MQGLHKSYCTQLLIDCSDLMYVCMHSRYMTYLFSYLFFTSATRKFESVILEHFLCSQFQASVVWDRNRCFFSTFLFFFPQWLPPCNLCVQLTRWGIYFIIRIKDGDKWQKEVVTNSSVLTPVKKYNNNNFSKTETKQHQRRIFLR